MAAKLAGGGGAYALKQNAEINVTPFVDILLVLLIIFMVAVPMATVSIKVDLPPATPPPENVKPKEPSFASIRNDGLFIGALLGGASLTELRQSWLAAEAAVSGGVSPRVAPMIDVRELGGLLQRAGLALPVADLDRTMVRYADAVALIHEIRELGLSNNLVGRSRTPVSRRLMGAAINHYQQHFADPDGRVRATVEVAWITGWAPHESQQQPLKPGSAKARLADALKVEEKKLP